MSAFRAKKTLYQTSPPFTQRSAQRLNIPAIARADWMLVENRFPSLGLLQKSGLWVKVYRDTRFTILRRSPG